MGASSGTSLCEIVVFLDGPIGGEVLAILGFQISHILLGEIKLEKRIPIRPNKNI